MPKRLKASNDKRIYNFHNGISLNEKLKDMDIVGALHQFVKKNKPGKPQKSWSIDPAIMLFSFWSIFENKRISYFHR